LRLFDLQKADQWLEKQLSYPGIGEEEFTLKKTYWLASAVCAIVILALTVIFKLINPDLKYLFAYGLIIGILFFLWLFELMLIRWNLEKRMFGNQIFITLVTFYFILKLGGIPTSGGLVFVGFFVVLFSLDFHKRLYSIILFILYVVTVVLAGVLQPQLTVPAEMTPEVNISLYVINLLWISSLSFLFVLNFIRERVKIEKREAERLKELNDLKTRLYSNITHEFRTPLTVILGMAELVRDQPEVWLEKGTRKITNSGRILLHQVNQMLDLSKLEASAMPVHMVQGDIIQFLHYLVEQFQSVAEVKGIALNYFPQVNQLSMDYDPEKTMQVFSNLISNALKYTGSGGSIEVIPSLEEEAGRQLMVRIRDNGPGISKEELPHIFERFYRIDQGNEQSIEGSGLGLALTRELVKLLGGTIEANSTIGMGTEFLVTLPIARNAPPEAPDVFSDSEDQISELLAGHQEETIPLPADGPEGKEKPSLLIVEDNRDVVEYLRSLLDPGYCIHVADNGKAGLEMARESVPDIILSDIMMPEMDGIQLLDALKNDIRTSHIPVVLLTAKADIASRLEGLERGADAYLSKPFNREELFLRLEKLIELREILRKRYSGDGQFESSGDQDFRLEDSFMQKVREVMTENLSDESFDVEQLCRAVYMSRAQLYRKFKSLTDKTIGEYLRTLRLKQAREMLASGKVNVSEAAYRTGFKNLSHFSRVFTEEFGINPSDIQK